MDRIRIACQVGLIGMLCSGLVGCATPKAIPTSEPVPSAVPTGEATSTVVSPSPTQDPLPQLTLQPRELYFRLDGKPSLVFSRNVAGMTPGGFELLVEEAHGAGAVLVRVGTDSPAMGGHTGYGYSFTGQPDEKWSAKWEHFFDVAEANGIYVVPTFTSWFNWSTTGFNTWANNPFNAANGGPASSPREIFRRDSPTQLLFIRWFKSVISRWQAHRNILAWEPISEVNLIEGISQSEGVYLSEQMTKAAREADAERRPVTASLADTGTWPDFYRGSSADFINVHPYPPSGQLDRNIISTVHAALALYGRPVLIGESGLSAAVPDSVEGKLTVAANAKVGVRHAIWAGVVSGAMNGRALWWEDGYGIYFPELGMPWLENYATAERAAANFVSGVDFSGFTPLTVSTSSAA